MFEKILVANRGEIACRVIRTARRLGIRTVAVYSDADRAALHVSLADEAVRVGPAASVDSYLSIERIVGACRESGADAVHPGYGFLSENASFATALDDAGIVFIGPPPEAITAMGDKITAKRIAAGAGVSVIPGFDGAIDGPGRAVEAAREIGYPVMLKASAGGGGKGMRIAADDDECREGFQRASSEAASSFGDDRVFVEKYVVQPRHIEIQVLADAHGNTLHLGERECSVQRRHQKVLEEAPSPFLDEATRAAMGAQAVSLAQAVGYRSAGTVEFVVDRERTFYFLEMNTRLQVEHPVTEEVTGLDLVEQMIRVAAGEPLAFTQGDVHLRGWALEARIYAEDPVRGFLPSTGRLTRFRAPPPDGHRVRVDTGVDEGDEISVHYDPMIAKLVTGGADRAEAIASMSAALDGLLLRGVETNVDFLSAVVARPRFRAGDLDTGFIDAEFPDGYQPGAIPEAQLAVFVVAAAVVQARWARRGARIGGRLPGRDTGPGDDWVVACGDGRHAVRVCAMDGHGNVEDVVYAGRSHRLHTDWAPGDELLSAELDGRPVCVRVEARDPWWRLAHGGHATRLLVLAPRAAELYELMPPPRVADAGRFLLSPMPGLLVRMSVAVGDRVKAGQELAVVEAMKMENVLRAASDACVAAVLVDAGDSLSVDQPIIEFE